ncbi:MAG TPA: hypothetical protein VIL36_19590 [Acidimicrobiales bacterium]
MRAHGGGWAVEVLGPLRVRDPAGADVTPDGVLQRRLLALLTLRRGHVVPVDALVDVLWPRARPSTATPPWSWPCEPCDGARRRRPRTGEPAPPFAGNFGRRSVATS